MKKIIVALFIIFLFAVISQISSKPNPIAFHFFNEFMFDSTGWKFELYSFEYLRQDSISLDGWYLTSSTDTAYFNNGIYLNFLQYKVISQSDLQTSFLINTERDSITLFNNDQIPMDELCLGILDFGYYVQMPKMGQSICYQAWWYLDNTPTLGFENDTLNANGYISGYVKDSLGNPIAGVKVIYGYIPDPINPIPIYIETNSSGYFSYYGLSIFKLLKFDKEGYFAPDTSIQIWPDSTITINIQMHSITGITELPEPPTNTFELTQNYPNPFNNSTTFIYSLAENGYVEINIYDEKGELIQKLFSGNQSKGEYKVNWNADNLASGIYFYELSVRTPSEKTGKQKLSKKCLLLK